MQSLRHPLLECKGGFGRHALPHHAEAARRERQEQRRLDDVPVGQGEDVVDRYRIGAFESTQ